MTFQQKFKRVLLLGLLFLISLEVIVCFYANMVLQNFEYFAYDGVEDTDLTSEGMIYFATTEGSGTPTITYKFPECTSTYINPPLVLIAPSTKKHMGDYGYAFSRWGTVEIMFDHLTNKVVGISLLGANFSVYPSSFSNSFSHTSEDCSILRQ